MKKVITKTIREDFEQKYLLEVSEGRVGASLRFIHDEARVKSRISICVLASGDARVRVDALLKIGSGAKATDAWLDILTIVRDGAQVDAAPELEIACDDVRAGHALRTRTVSDEELFYLMSRGIEREEAERLVVEGLVEPYRNAERIVV